MDMQRIKSGIEGVDQAIGGFPKGRTILVTGNAGSGKTIFGLQFSITCCRNGLKTVLLSTEENASDLVSQASSFGWDIKKFEEDGRFSFVEFAATRAQEIESAMSIRSEANKGNFEGLLEYVPEDTQVLVIDSLGSHTANLKPREFKDRLDLLVYKIHQRNITTILVLDSATSKEYNDLAMFSVNGAIILLKRENPYTGRRERVMDIVKMRNTKTPIQLLTFDIMESGIAITSAEDNNSV